MNTKYIFERYYEKSKGKGLFDSDLYGLSFLLINNETNEVQQIDLSKAFETPEKLNRYLKTIGLEEVEKADLFGEIKVINS